MRRGWASRWLLLGAAGSFFEPNGDLCATIYVVASKTPTLASLELNLPRHYSGKVRENWVLDDGRRVMIATDRLSALDKIHGFVPGKGQVLNQLAAWWFQATENIVANHLIDIPDPNVTVAQSVDPLKVEVVVRSRLTGSTSTSMLPRYLAGERDLYGYQMPDGLKPHGPLPEFMITPTTKADHGDHDAPITVAEVSDSGIVEPDVWAETQKVAMALFEYGYAVAEAKGFLLADTKYEFGLDNSNNLVLIDEIHTPDSSRYWKIDSLEERLADGEHPEGFDKEPFRLALKAAGYTGGDTPELPDEVWNQLSARYQTIFSELTGQEFVPGEAPIEDRIKSSLSTYLGIDL